LQHHIIKLKNFKVMRSAFFFTTLLLFAGLHINAGNYIRTADTPCLACDTPGGMVADNITDSTANLSWGAVAGASNYTIEIQDEQNTPSTFHVETSVSGALYSVAGLKPGVLYKFKVRTRCGNDKSDWSGWTFFKAGSGNNGGGSGPCNVPAGLTASIKGDSALLTWNAVGGANQYTVEIEDEQNTPSTFHIETTVSGTSYVVTGLKAGVSYKFKVRSRCAGGQSDWSAWMFFNGAGNTTSGGGSGTCTVPAALSVAVNGNTALLSWKKVSGAAQYYVEIEDEQNTPSVFHLEVSTQDSFYSVSGLQAGVSYKFKVRTHCGGSQSDWSTWLFFNGTGGGNGGGGTSSNCIRPSGPMAINLTSGSAVLIWSAVPGVSSYTVEIEQEPSGPNAWQITKVSTTNTITIDGLAPLTRYKFKVRSNCSGGGNSDWTAWRKFKTPASLVSKDNKLTANTISPDDNPIVNRAENTREIVATQQLTVWPNPVTQQNGVTVRVQFPATESITLRLLDLAGRVVQTQSVQPESGSWEGALNLDSHLPDGVYLLQARNSQYAKMIKLILNR